MKRQPKKYIIRESELKEIVQEMLLMELFNPNDYNHLDIPGRGHNQTPTKPVDYLRIPLNILRGSIPDSWKEKAAEDNGFLQYLLGLIGAQKAGTARPDYIPNPIQAWGKGQNANAQQKLNVNAAVNWLRNHAYPHYDKKKCGHCAKYVRMALNAGGLQVPHGMPAPSAKYYLNIFPSNGWQEIPVNQAGELCDVVVIAPCKDSKGGDHPDGHIAMCIGNGVWASDYIQKTMHGLAGAPPPSAIHVYRYKNRV